MKKRTLKIKILGRVASKKNAKRVIKVRGRLIPISSKFWLKFESDALKQIENQKIVELIPPYEIQYDFRMKGESSTDIDNMMAGINDLLEKAGVLVNDKYILRVSATKSFGWEEYETYIVAKEVS